MRYHHRSKNSAIFIVPSMITVASMCSGFYAMVQAVSGHIMLACVAVFISMVLDGLDGRIARLTKTSSPFGAELDNLADMVAFGVAPSLITYLWYGHQFGVKTGVAISFIYCACVAIRLAKFQTNSTRYSKYFFSGLPSPAAAGLVVGYIYLTNAYKDYYFWLNSDVTRYVGVALLILTALTMISNIKFYSFKEFHLHKKAPFRTLLISLLLLVLVLNFPDIVVYSFFVVYLCASYLMWLFRISYKTP